MGSQRGRFFCPFGEERKEEVKTKRKHSAKLSIVTKINLEERNQLRAVARAEGEKERESLSERDKR